MEIFSSCFISNVEVYTPHSYPKEKIELSIRTRKNYPNQTFIVPGLGLERRDFKREKKKKMSEWGEGAKRLLLRVHLYHEPPSCKDMLEGKTYVAWAYHMNNLGHFYETIFRLFTEIKKRGDLADLQTIFFMNSEAEVPHRPLFDVLFPGVQILSPVNLNKGNTCLEKAVFVGFPNHGFGREGTPSLDMNSFHNFLRQKFELKTMQARKNKPIVVFLSRKTRSGNRARRFLVNEEQLAEFIRNRTDWDVRVVEMDKLDFQHQVRLMYQTSILISVHTGGFYNLAFMQEGSLVVQINVAGTHFGTLEYETRPQLPFWKRGMWHMNIERICEQRGMIFVEEWAEPNFQDARNLVGYSKMGYTKQVSKYMEWASTSLPDFVKKWEYCHKVQDSLRCEDDIGNEMRAHSTADELYVPEIKLWRILAPYQKCINVGTCFKASSEKS